MNTERIKYAISIMEQAQNLNMRIWQNRTDWDSDYATTIEDLHTCGNTACFAGYIAISPLFQEVGGVVVEVTGTPKLNGMAGEDALLEFFEAPFWMKPFFDALVYGELGTLEFGEPVEDQEEATFQFQERLVNQINVITQFIAWNDWKPEHVIEVLQALLKGEFNWLEEHAEDIKLCYF